MKLQLRVLIFVALAVSAATNAVAQCGATDLGTLRGMESSEANAVNDRGEVVGSTPAQGATPVLCVLLVPEWWHG